MTEIIKNCSNCEGSKYCISRPNKKDYKFPEEENQYLIDLECGIWNCHTAINKLLKENKELKRDKTELVNSITELENKITELEKQIDQLSNDNHVLKTAFITQKEQIENLNCTIDTLSESLKQREEQAERINVTNFDVIKKLKAQIEAMKCCGNCDNNAYCDKEHYGNDKGCENWEIAE